MRPRFFGLAAALLAAAAMLVAGPAPAKAAETLTLDVCLDVALKESMAVKQAESDVAAAKMQLKQAGTDFWPSVSTTWGYQYQAPQRSSSGMLVPQSNFAWQIQANQTVFNGFALQINERLRELGVDQSLLLLDQKRLELVLSVKSAYFNILLAEKGQMVAEQAVRQLESQVDVARNFFQVGMIPQVDVLQAEVDLANSRQDLITAANAVRSTKATLNSLMRRDVNREINVADVLDYTPENPTFDASVAKALTNRPEIKRLDKSVTAGQESVDLARSGYYPSVSLFAAYQKTGEKIEMNGSDVNAYPETTTLGVNLSWQVWDWFKRDYRVEEQQALLLKARHALNEIKDNITLQVKNAILEVDRNRENIQVSKKAIEQAEESSRMARERYREQVATSTEVLDAQTRLSRAQRNYYAALYGYHLALHQLKLAMGEM